MYSTDSQRDLSLQKGEGLSLPIEDRLCRRGLELSIERGVLRVRFRPECERWKVGQGAQAPSSTALSKAGSSLLSMLYWCGRRDQDASSCWIASTASATGSTGSMLAFGSQSFSMSWRTEDSYKGVACLRLLRSVTFVSVMSVDCDDKKRASAA